MKSYTCIVQSQNSVAGPFYVSSTMVGDITTLDIKFDVQALTLLLVLVLQK